MPEPSNLTELSIQYLRETVLSTIEIAIALILLCIPILLPLATENSTWALFGFLGILGWSLYFGQELALQKSQPSDSSQRESSDEKEGIAKILYVVSALLYHNGIVFIGIALGISFTQTGSPMLAVAVAFLYPVFDTFTANRRIPIPVSFGGIAAFVIWVLSHLVKVLRGMSWESLGLDRFSIRFIDIFDKRKMPRIP